MSHSLLQQWQQPVKPSELRKSFTIPFTKIFPWCPIFRICSPVIMSVFIVPVRRGINDRQSAVNSNLQNGGGRVKRGVLHKYTRHEAYRIQNGGHILQTAVYTFLLLIFQKRMLFSLVWGHHNIYPLFMSYLLLYSILIFCTSARR